MTAPIRNPQGERYELYRVILDYEALQDGFMDRIDDLNTSLDQIDLAGGLTRGNTQRLLTRNPGKPRSDRPSSSSRRTFGWESLGKMLKGTGLALVLVVDDERFAPIKDQLMTRRRPPPANAGKQRPTWLFTKEKAREMGKKRFASMTPEQRKRHQRKAQKASARARRRKSAKTAVPVADPIQQPQL
jgi:hypothetical protein